MRSYSCEILKFNLIICFLLAILAINTSCTRLQYRESDEELQEKFEASQLEPQISYFEVDSLKAKIRILKIAKNEKDINVIFFHGSPSSLSSWSSYLNDSLLLENANLWAMDRPGLGYSNFGKSMPSIKLQAEVINSIINAYNLKNVITVGTSYGGPIAARLAVLNKNVKGVILISSAMDSEQERQFWGSRLTQWWATRWLVPRGYRVAGDEKTIHAEELKQLEEDWSKVRVPVIHIHGDKDDIVPYGNVNYTKKHFKNIKIIRVPNVGHEISYRRSDLVKPLILEMIDLVKFKNP
ncbi:alpha/beta fold hydrolase [Gillisia marina]|uniref:alpha/beta fold hydrolase n=1 Tax=Gillisia marina TaxID=1167637 RepID=UPI00029A1F33|nr:alpha/beta hydrolase [Gillisia marina]